MEFSPRAAELTTLLESRISNFYTNFQVDEIGRVVSVGDGIARVYGLNEIQAGEMVEFEPICIYLVISLLVSLILLGVPFLFASNSIHSRDNRVRAFIFPKQYILSHMNRKLLSGSSSSSSSSPSNSNNKRKDKRKEKEDCLRNLVLKEVDEYLTKYKKKIIAEFPGAHPYIETPSFLNKVTAELIRGAGLIPTDTDPKMNLLDSVHHNLIQDFNLVKKEGYINNAIYDCIRCLLKDYH